MKKDTTEKLQNGEYKHTFYNGYTGEKIFTITNSEPNFLKDAFKGKNKTKYKYGESFTLKPLAENLHLDI